MNTNANISELMGNTMLSERDARVHDKLRRELGPVICAALADETVIEIMLNPDGALWIERLGGGMERAGFMTPSQAEAAIATTAAMLKTTVDWRDPILLCELPLDGSRFTAKIPPLVAAPSFTIRRHAIQVFRLADYVEAGIMTAAQSAAVRRAVAERQNILVVGGTGSGKTTLVNAVIAEMAEIAPEHRLILIEDTRELQCLSPNYVAYRANPRQPQSACVSLALRDRPDRLIIGEARGGEALDILKAWNTGHPGGAATIHANSALAGLTRLGQLCAEATPAPQHEVIGEAVDLIVFIAKTPGARSPGRRVEEIVRVHGWDGRAYVTSTES
jgi:P-type conjugative transfer ATPase TrbB